MAYICFNCGKRSWMGVRGQHHKGVAGGQWKHKAQKSTKIFRPNLHEMRLWVGETIQRVKLCTDCISLLRKNGQLVKNGVVLKSLNSPVRTNSRPAAPRVAV